MTVSTFKIDKAVRIYCSQYRKTMTSEKDTESLERLYAGILYHSNFLPWGTRTLRGGIRTYSPCVLDRTPWNDFFLTLPKDYDIRNDPVFDCSRSTYRRLMDVGAPVPEPTTAEMLRTGFCGPDPASTTRPAFLRYRDNDKRPEPAYRLHLSERAALHHLRADPLEGTVPFGRSGDMNKSKSVTHRDFKWRQCCPAQPPVHATFERKVHRYANTDLHGRFVNEVVKFDDDDSHRYFNQKLMKLKKAYHWPKNPITGEALGGHLLYHLDDPCTPSRRKVWPCGEKDILSCNRISMPEDRCDVFAHKVKEPMRTRERHFHQKSHLDMRYPLRNYECWEEVPACCGEKHSDFPSESEFVQVQADFPCPQARTCPPKPPCNSS